MVAYPNIQPLQWTQVRDVLPNEASGFTPWLADNLELLADALGLDDLELVGTESRVDAFRVDIRAKGTDGSGEEIAVVVENQYGKTDHDHLGKLVTYSARADAEAERVLAVWVVEEPVAAHLAAVEFLNRISADHVGWVLLSPRFVAAAEGFYIHFEKHAEPNAFLRATKTSAGTEVPPERTAFMTGIFERIDAPLRKAGFRHVWVHPDGHMIRAYLANHLPASEWAEMRVLAQRERFRVVLFVRGRRHVDADHNRDVLEGIRTRHAQRLQQALGQAWSIEWHASKDHERSDYARVTWEGHGYGSAAADVDAAAELVRTFATACLEALRDDTDEEFPDPDDLLDDQTSSADTETVSGIAACIQPGEWTSYGDVSRVATGTTSAAMAVGRIASTAGFPNPHRVLTKTGEIPAGWSTPDGAGPAECRQRLEAEGVTFTAGGRADPGQRAGAEELRSRWQHAKPHASSGGTP